MGIKIADKDNLKPEEQARIFFSPTGSMIGICSMWRGSVPRAIRSPTTSWQIVRRSRAASRTCSGRPIATLKALRVMLNPPAPLKSLLRRPVVSIRMLEACSRGVVAMFQDQGNVNSHKMFDDEARVSISSHFVTLERGMCSHSTGDREHRPAVRSGLSVTIR